MITSYGKLSPKQVRETVLNCFNNFLEFTPCCAVIVFKIAAFTAVIGYTSFLTIVNLRKNCLYANITSISVLEKGPSLLGYASTDADTRAPWVTE